MKINTDDSRAEFSLLKVFNPNAVLLVDKTGRVFVYDDNGEKLDTGVRVPVRQNAGQVYVYEVMRELGLACAKQQVKGGA